MFTKKKQPSDTRRARTAQPARSPVFSYYANRSVRTTANVRQAEEQQAPPKRLPRIVWRQRLPAIAAGVGVLLLTGLCLQLSSVSKVVPVGPQESQVFLRDKRIYEAAAQDIFDSFLNRNKLTVDTNKIALDLQRRFPELAVVSVSLPLFGSHPIVYIQPATPKLILVSASGMYILDVNGRALLPANQVSRLESLKIPVVQDESSLTIQGGEIALPRATVAFIAEVVGQHKAKGIEITSLTLPPGANELHVRPAGAGYYVKYNVHGRAREAAGTYFAVKARLDAEKKTPKEYLDVRVEQRAYYR